MPRAIWSGAISFGLVNIPVKLFSAVSRKTVRFHQLDGESGSRIQQKRVSEGTGEEVPYENLVKGYEIGPDRYVIITPEELDSISPEKTRTIDIEDFVDLDQIDPIFYDHPYYLVPDTGAEKAYRLLVRRDGGVGQGRDRPRGPPLQGEPRGHPPARRGRSRWRPCCSPTRWSRPTRSTSSPTRREEDHQARAGHGARS